MEYILRTTALFEKKFNKIIPLNKQKDMRRRILNLKYNPYIGKPLGYSYFRELKINKFRIYYEIYDEDIVVLLLDVSDKKRQQEAINIINTERELRKKYVKNLKKGSII